MNKDQSIPAAMLEMKLKFLYGRPENTQDYGWTHAILSGVLGSAILTTMDVLEGDVPWTWDKKEDLQRVMTQATICVLIEKLCTTCITLGMSKESILEGVNHGWDLTKFNLSTPDDAGFGNA